MSSAGPEKLVVLIDLLGRVLGAQNRAEIGFIAVNETHALMPYRQAILWSQEKAVVAVSGLAVHEENAPFMLWLKKLCAFMAKDATQTKLYQAGDLPSKLAEEWGEWLPNHAVWLPLGGELGLLFAHEEEWEEIDILLLSRLGEAVLAAWRACSPKPLLSRLFLIAKRAYRGWIMALLLFFASFLPITGSVLAPADTVPAHPLVVRSPLEGVLEKIVVQPNDKVEEGDLLFELNSTALMGKLDVARQQQATQEAEYRAVAQAQVFDPKAKAQVAVLLSKVEERAAEVKYLEAQLERIKVRATQAGIVVFDDPTELIGKPLVVGEKVMFLADPQDSEIEAWVAVPDVGEVKLGGRLILFLNIAPLEPVYAEVKSLAYEATIRPDGNLAHRVKAVVLGEAKPRLGLKGTARIEGDKIPIIWWLFRKPVAAVRQSIGF